MDFVGADLPSAAKIRNAVACGVSHRLPPAFCPELTFGRRLFGWLIGAESEAGRTFESRPLTNRERSQDQEFGRSDPGRNQLGHCSRLISFKVSVSITLKGILLGVSPCGVDSSAPN